MKPVPLPIPEAFVPLYPNVVLDVYGGMFEKWFGFVCGVSEGRVL